MFNLSKVNLKSDTEAAKFLIGVVSDLVEIQRITAENTLKLFLKLLPALQGTNAAEDISHYFFGRNPNIEKVMEDLLKELKIIE